MSVVALQMMSAPNQNNIPLQDRAMNARFSTKCPSFRVTDTKIARDVADRLGSDVSMHKHRRLTLAKGALSKITQIIGKAEGFHLEHTSPWEDEGVRVLATPMFDEYMKEMRLYERQFNAAVAAFVPTYPSLIEEARPLLGDAFNPKNYPHPTEIANKFGFAIKVTNLSLDFRCTAISPEEEARIRDEIASRTQTALDNVTQNLLEQMKGHVARMVDRLQAYNEREKGGGEGTTGTFRDSMVNNIKDFIERLPKMNITNDSRIEAFRVQVLNDLCKNTPEDLRKSPGTRNQVLAKAEKINAAVSELI